MRNHLVVATLILCLCQPVLAQDRRPQMDESGKGAVLCIWSIYVALHQGVELCELEVRDSDRAIASDIARIEAFILEHTTEGINQATLDDYKARVFEQTQTHTSPEQMPNMCKDVAMMRDALGSDIAGRTDDLLSVPREPLWNPCI